MRILHMHMGENGHGGIESTLLTLLRMNDDKLESHFALYFDERLAERLRAAGANVHLAGGGAHLRNPLSVLNARRHFVALLREDRVDAVVFHNSLAWLWIILAPAVKRARVPLAIWFHDPWFHHPFEQNHWLERLARLTRPDLLLFNSQATQSRLLSLYPGLDNLVVHPPVEPPPDASRQRLATRAELGASGDAVAIAHVARMTPGKGHSLLLQALSRLRDLPRWVCWMVGAPQQAQEQSYFESLKRMAVEIGIAHRVKFVGYYPDLVRVYAAADIYCQPNIALEPFGLTFIEALYTGLPCVATVGSGGPETILTEDCGVIVPPNNPDALAAVLTELIHDRGLRKRLGANGPARARQLCDPAKQMAKLQGVMLEACPRLRRRTEAAVS